MHAAADLCGGEGADIVAFVVELSVVAFQPGIELETQEPRIDLVGGEVGDGADAKKWVGGPPWAPGGRQAQRGKPLCP
ncbi:hypothetical protein [Mesorhizobium sp. M2D.F.Ca.ET.223.01.1.1]|uniref:hypothetical protein n=1 Tax=Mesorhizobium sp. M2D.F.Ca.ET.223.01.1.1 TaxID=2563940 RepID=UPI001FDFCCD0|nr:hypothetical protein [Mesorhizobium sp. M2D.F.Ca.ET.223.01.1.1]